MLFRSDISHFLLSKLELYAISGSLSKWLLSYLFGRCQRVVIEAGSSNCLSVVSGVPQGSIHGPFLFLLCINDLSNVVSSRSNLALIADDSKCFRKISTLEDGLNFQG